MVSVAASGSTSWVCDPSLESYALEQPEMLRNHDYRHKCHAPFKCAPAVFALFTSHFTFYLPLRLECVAVSPAFEETQEMRRKYECHSSGSLLNLYQLESSGAASPAAVVLPPSYSYLSEIIKSK